LQIFCEIIEVTKQLLPKKSEEMYGISMSNVKKYIMSIAAPLFHIFINRLKQAKSLLNLKLQKLCQFSKVEIRLPPTITDQSPYFQTSQKSWKNSSNTDFIISLKKTAFYAKCNLDLEKNIQQSTL